MKKGLLQPLRWPRRARASKVSAQPEAIPSLAQELADLSIRLPTTAARDQAYTLVHAIERMTQECLRASPLYTVSSTDRAQALTQLVESLGRFDWRTLGLDPKATAAVLDDAVLDLLVSRIAAGESLGFLEDLCYERYHAYDHADPSLSALRLPNTRRRGPTQSLRPQRVVRKLPQDVGRVEQLSQPPQDA